MKKKLTAVIAGAVAASSILLASVFASPAELNSSQTITELPQTSIVQTADLPDNGDDNEKKRSGRSVRSLLRTVFINAPMWVKTLVLTPLIIIGRALLGLMGFLQPFLGAVASPIAGFIGSALFKGLALTAMFALLFKALFPKRKLKDFLTLKNIIILFGAGLVLTTADRVLLKLWAEYKGWRSLIVTIGEVLILLAVWLCAFRGKNRVGVKIKELMWGKGGVIMLFTSVASAVLHYVLENVTAGFWSFLPETLPLCMLAGVFVCLVFSRRKRPAVNGQAIPFSTAV